MSGTQDHRRTSEAHDGSSTNGGPSRSLITYRRAIPTDKNFIYSTWLKGLYYGNEWFREIDKDIYFQYYSKIIQYILSKPLVGINCACLEDDPEVILGYAVYEVEAPKEMILHWIFVKSAWRKLGIAKTIMPSQIKKVTHLTKVGTILKPKDWVFNPFIT